MENVTERRAAERIELHLAARVQTRPQTGESFTYQTTLENVSSKGAYFYLADPLAPATPVELEIELPKSVATSANLKMNLTGAVVRTLPDTLQAGRHGIAIQFDGQWNVEPVLA